MQEKNPIEIIKEKLGTKAAELFNALSEQELGRADAIVFLQGDQLDRASAAISLYKKGLSDLILISGNNILIGPNTRPEECDSHLDVLKKFLLNGGVSEDGLLVSDRAMNSKGQAEDVVRIAKERGWSSIIVVVSKYHMLRSFLAFVKQGYLQLWEGKIMMHGAELDWNSVPSGRVNTAIEMLSVESDKIKKYKHDLATVEEGVNYIQSL